MSLDDVSARPSREWTALLALLGLFAVAWLLVGAGANVPVIDDWVYAWSVEHLLETGRLHVLGFSAIYPISQILWGALFARIAGFSFGVLRFSTILLSVGGCWAVYLILRELGCRRSTSLLGAFALALHPVYFALSFSFMTDVPFLNMSAIAVCCYIRGIRRSQAAALWAGSGWAVAAFLVRPVGIMLPLSLLAAVGGTGRWRTTLRQVAPSAVTTLVLMLGLQVAMPRMMGPLDWAVIRQEGLQYLFLVPLSDYGRWNANMLFVALFPFAPLFVAFAIDRRHALPVAGVATLLAAASWVALGGLSMPLPDWQTWSLQELTARSLIGGDLAVSHWSSVAAPFVRLLGLLPVASLIVIGWRRWRGGSPDQSDLVFLTLVALHIGAINVLWLFNDRYYLVLAPALAIVGARALDQNTRGKWIAGAFLVLWAIIGVSGMRDVLAFNDAVGLARRDLEASGIPAWDIDAGYSSNGWRLYAHSENLPPGADPRYDVPFVTSKQSPHYSITNTPIPGAEVVRVIPLGRVTWQASNTIYVMRRQ